MRSPGCRALVVAAVCFIRAYAFVQPRLPVSGVSGVRWHDAARARRTRMQAFPDYVPQQAAAEIEDPDAVEVMRNMRRRSVAVAESIVAGGSIETNYVSVGPAGGSGDPPVLLIHGFDSSVLEFRRLLPQLAELGVEAHAVDVLGWGFTQLEGVRSFGAEAKRQHLHAFWREVLGGRPMVLAGASLGGAIAVDFALEYPEAVEKLILIDGQALIDGSGPGASLPGPLAKLGIRVLGSKPLRMMANKMAYYDKKRLATEDAMRIGRLHTLQPGWEGASLSYMCSGGFAVSTRLGDVAAPTLVLWGRQDEILDPRAYAERYGALMRDASLVWVEDCGHVPHLEQAAVTARTVAGFAGASAAAAAGAEKVAAAAPP